MEHKDRAALEAGVEHIRAAPADDGTVAMIVRRPAVGERELLEEGTLDETVGLVGDSWKDRRSSTTPDGSANPLAQLTLMNARAAELMAGDRERWPLAGDQLFVDFDLGVVNIPPGTRLSIGEAVVEVTDKPHTGCAKFKARFGKDALQLVNSEVGRELNLRGINTKVIAGGAVRTGDTVRKLTA